MKLSDLPAKKDSPGEVNWPEFIRRQSAETGLSEQRIVQCMSRADKKCQERSRRMFKKWFPKATLV